MIIVNMLKTVYCSCFYLKENFLSQYIVEPDKIDTLKKNIGVT